MKQKKFNGFNKIGAGLIFTAACFIAAFVLAEFHDVYIAVAGAGILLMISAYFLLTSTLSDKVGEWTKIIEENEAEEQKKEEETPSNKEAEFREQIKEYMESADRTQRAMFAMLKRTTAQQEASLTEIGKQIEKLTETQNSGVKTLVKYNKENAKQMAINERETISELKKSVTSVIKETSEELQNTIRVEFEELSKVSYVRAVPLEEVAVTEVPVAEEIPVVEEVPVMEEVPLVEEIPVVEEVPVVEEIPVVEEVPAEEPPVEEDTPAETFDPNAALTPEEIAKLFASFGN